MSDMGFADAAAARAVAEELRAQRTGRANDMGFADAQAARSISRRLVLRERLRRALELGSSILDRLDQTIQPDGSCAIAVLTKEVALALGDQKSAVRSKPIDLIEGKDVREKKMLEGSDLVLQYLDALFEGVSHGLFSKSVETEDGPNRVGAAAHRLCEGAN